MRPTITVDFPKRPGSDGQQSSGQLGSDNACTFQPVSGEGIRIVDFSERLDHFWGCTEGDFMTAFPLSASDVTIAFGKVRI